MQVLGSLSYTNATIGWILRNEPDNHNLLIGFGARHPGRDPDRGVRHVPARQRAQSLHSVQQVTVRGLCAMRILAIFSCAVAISMQVQGDVPEE